MLKALQATINASVLYGILVTWVLFSHGVVLEPYDDLLHGKGKITCGALYLSSSHVRFVDSEDEEEEEEAVEEENVAPPQYDQQMPTYFQDFENRLFDQSTQIEMLEHRVDEQF